MNRLLLAVIFLVANYSLSAQVNYTLTFAENSEAVAKVSVGLPSPASAVNFVMPRSVPGDYSINPFDAFVENIAAITANGERIPLIKNEFDAPRWASPGANTKPLARIEYEVNLEKMERKMPPGSSSVARRGFVGLLNYSVFGWIEGAEKQKVRCAVKAPDTWAIFSSNQPTAAPKKGEFSFEAASYHELADGQLFLGTAFQVKEFKGLTPLFVASYCQLGDEFLDDYGKQGVKSLEILKDYFGEIPFRHYSLMLVRATPLEPGNAPQLAMEHLASATFFGDTSAMRKAAMTDEERNRAMPTYLHHIAHAYIPLRAYGDSYRPFVQEIPPIIKNIWLNEGFMWFLVYDTLRFERMKTNFRNSVYNTSESLKKLTLTELSQLGSTAYGVDFRIGRAIFSRGALMALEMNEHLLKESGGKKSMKDVIRYLYHWGKQNRRAFTAEELPQLLNQACGISLQKIYDKWQLPVS
jgi:predicted metalloprotease with PDZ domain